jgi:hypothetical protein
LERGSKNEFGGRIPGLSLFFFRTGLIWDIGSYNLFTIVLGEKTVWGAIAGEYVPNSVPVTNQPPVM